MAESANWPQFACSERVPARVLAASVQSTANTACEAAPQQAVTKASATACSYSAAQSDCHKLAVSAEQDVTPGLTPKMLSPASTLIDEVPSEPPEEKWQCLQTVPVSWRCRRMSRIVVIAASTGGLAPLRQIVAALPPTFQGSVIIVWHTGGHTSHLPTLLRRPDGLPVSFAEDNAPIKAGHVYVAPPDRHVLLQAARMILDAGPKIHHTRPAANPLFLSAAKAYGPRVVGVVLSGQGADGASGLRAIQLAGGLAIAQHPDEAVAPAMPLSAMAADGPTVLTVEEIATLLATPESVEDQSTNL